MTGQQSALADDAVADDAVARIQRVPVPGWGPLDGDCGAAGPACLTTSPADAPGAGWLPSPDDQDCGEPGADWPHVFARMLVEMLAGTRPARQILPWTTTRARSQFDRLLRGFGGAGAPGAGRPVPGTGGVQPRIVRVVATRPASDVIEMSVIARFGARVRALALRLERPSAQAPARTRRPDAVLAGSPGWVCTDIEAA
jgi:hypothetical protein